MKYPSGNYDDKQVLALTKLLDDVCAELAIDPADQKRREWVAMVLLVCSNRAPYDHQKLQTEVVRQCRIQDGLAAKNTEPSSALLTK